MINKKVIRKDNVAGKFTTIHLSILNDKRLSGNDLRILISILSDADNFNLTRELIMNRFQLNKKTVQQCFKNLEELGYIKRAELKRGYFYTISEYGNLNNESIVKPQIESKIEQIIAPIEQTKPVSNKSKPISKSVASASSLGTIRSQYHIVELFDAILPFVQLNAGGNMITIAAKDDIVKRTMLKFISADDNLTDGKVKNYILSIKGEYSKAGQLDQKYQN